MFGNKSAKVSVLLSNNMQNLLKVAMSNET